MNDDDHTLTPVYVMLWLIFLVTVYNMYLLRMQHNHVEVNISNGASK